MGERESGKFPSQPLPNPKGQYGIGNSLTSTHGQEQVQAITTLRSGKQVDNQVVMPEEASDTTREEESQAKPTGNVGPDTVIPSVEDQSKRYVPKALYPERLTAPKKSSKYDDIFGSVQACIDQHCIPRCHPKSAFLCKIFEGSGHSQDKDKCAQESFPN